ncbi:toxin glutamine deamidase domain-containing protein [Nocardia sp. PE-7]|uniref:toxin glutamine deamidase domain-containing protein n=1 Tax=Nocardia sp. PE-7 TaxID=3058426 RepID=UPI002657B598|nr:toxin glutamine deamidase domain-containing protein [Nocardia sp. PE-7]WKG10335.1 toxin glutamine deamidase domain-containing protein [Nocardia sp. PE-7]
MGIEIPDELAWVAKYILGAGDWPEGDETAMRRVADGWTAMANTLDTVDDNAALALNAALTALSEGETHTAITAYRDKLLSGDEATFAAVRKWCEKQAELLEDGANDIEHTKLVIIATMVIAAVEIGAAIATSWTGIGAVAGVAARVAAQVAVRVAIRQLIARMLTRGAAKAAARLALRGAAFEALEEGGTDLGARLIQVAKGDRSGDKFGWTDLGLATFGGAVGGAAGGLLGGGTGALGDVASSTAGKLAGKVVGGTVTELGADLSAQVATAGVGAAFLGQEFKLDVGVDTFTSAGAGGVQSALESSSHGGNSTAPTVPDLGSDLPGSTTPAGTDTPSGDQSPNGSSNTGPNAPTSPNTGDTGGSTNPASTAPTGDGATPQNGSPNTSAPGESAPTSPNDNGANGTPPAGDSAQSNPNNNGSTGTPDAGETAPSSTGSPAAGDATPSSPNGNGANPTPPTGDTTPSNPTSDTATGTPQSGDSPTAPNSNAPTETPSAGDPSPTDDTATPAPTGSSLDLPTQDSSTQPNAPTDNTPNTATGQQNPTPSDNGQSNPTLTTPTNPQPTTPDPTNTPDSTGQQPTTSTPTTQESTPQQSPTSTPAATTASPISTTSQPATPSNTPTHIPADTTRPSSNDTATAAATTATTPQTANPTTTPTAAPPPTATQTSTPTPPISQAPSPAPSSPRSTTTPPATTGTPQSTSATPPTTTPSNTPGTTPSHTETPITHRTSSPTPQQTLGTSPTPPSTPDTQQPFGPNPTPTSSPSTPNNTSQPPTNQARELRESLRGLPSQDGRTTSVDANRSPFVQRPPAYRIRRFHLGGNRWVAVATIRAHIPNAHLMSPNDLRLAMEAIQATVDATFNNGSPLLSGDRFLVDVEFTTDPAAADTVLDPSRPAGIANTLRDHLGLFPAPPGQLLSPSDLREISNDIARANTPSRIADPANSRVIDHRELADVEDPLHQSRIEDSLRAGNGFIQGADPRTHPYGQLTNDGGRTVPGRGNNCLDCSLSALSSFFGLPRVSAPRWPDQLPNGQPDNVSGEWNGHSRAAACLGANWASYSGMPIPDQYQALHNYIAGLGPGSAAMVGTRWHARDQNGNKLYNNDGSPVYRGGHATVIVFPPGAAGPVWWDPQSGQTSDAPPAYLTNDSAALECIPIDANGGSPHGGTSTHPGTGQTFAGPSVRSEPGVQHPGEQARLGMSADAVAGGGRPEGNGLGQLRDQQTYGGDHGALEHGDAGDRGGVRRDDGSGPTTPGLPDPSETAPNSPDSPVRGPEHDRVPSTTDLLGEPGRSGDDSGSRDHQESDPSPAHGPSLSGGDVMGVRTEPEHGDMARGGDDRAVGDQPSNSAPPTTAPQSSPATAVPNTPTSTSQPIEGTTTPSSQSSVNQTQPSPPPTPPPGTSPAPVSGTTPTAHQPATPTQSIPTPQQLIDANQSRTARENLRSQHPDGGVRHVVDPLGGRSFTWGRFTTAFNTPVSMLRVGVHMAGVGNLDPAIVQALLERAQLAVDLHFNRGEQLLSGDWMMVDLVPVSDPAAADMTIDLDSSNPDSTPTDADLDALTGLLREQLGLPPSDTDLDVDDLRELSNSIARANTPAVLDGLPGTRVEGPARLDSLEQAEYQHDVEDALRDGNRFMVGADPRTNDYGSLINDGGPTVQGRSNNCLDGSLAALSSFNGRPEVGSPRWPDLDADGDLDTRSGEENGLDRATAWLGGTWQLGDVDLAVSAQFQALHDQIRSMGPGASALVVNTWHARDQNTGELLYELDGSPTIDGSHATVIVYPHGAAGPVWWDPQSSEFSDTPPHNLTSGSVELWSMPVDTQGVTNAGSTTGHQGTSAGIPSGSVPNPDILGDRVQTRVGLPTGAQPGAESTGPGTRPDELRPRQTDRDSDSAPQPAPVDDRRDVRPGDRDRPAGERTADLSQTPTGDIPAPDRELGNDHVPSDSDVTEQSDRTTRGVPVDVRQANPETGPARTDGLPGDLESPVAQTSPTELADGRNDRGLVDAESDAPEQVHTGGAIRPRDDAAAFDWAEEAYTRFRSDDSDIDEMARALADQLRADGTYFTRADLEQIKNHVFRTQHPMVDYDGNIVHQLFDADPNMAEAWIRLRAGRPLPADMVLLEHELAESTYMRMHPGSTYQDAHAHANTQHDWSRDIPPSTRERYDTHWGEPNGATGLLQPDQERSERGGVPIRGDQGQPGPDPDHRQDERSSPSGTIGGRDLPNDSRQDHSSRAPREGMAEERDDRLVADSHYEVAAQSSDQIDTNEHGPRSEDPRRLGRTLPLPPDHASPPDPAAAPPSPPDAHQPDSSPTQPLSVPAAIPLPPHLQAYFDLGESTPAGRSYFEESDSEMREYAQWVGALQNFYTIDMHGDPEAVFIGDDELSPKDLAALIRADPRWQNRAIRLLCCETGQGPDPFAQHLANELGVQVWAPNEIAWTDEDGTVVVATEVVDPVTGEVDAKDPPDGDWILFEPESQ